MEGIEQIKRMNRMSAMLARIYTRSDFYEFIELSVAYANLLRTTAP